LDDQNNYLWYFCIELELLVGKTGLVCFGQAAFFGIGAYSTVIFSTDVDQPLVAVLLPISIGFAAMYALIVGALSIRRKGLFHYGHLSVCLYGLLRYS
jgi:branched-chain amino acid transport system permease protein